jgi:hypothetical protein
MSNFLVYLSAFCEIFLAFLGIAVTVHEDWSKKHKGLVWSLFLIVALSGMYAIIKLASISSAEMATAQTKLSNSLDSVRKSSEEQARLSSLNAALQEKLLKQSDTITKLAEQNIGEATGGDSFCYLVFSDMGGSRFLLTAVSKGTFPLRNVSASITDGEKFKKATIGKPNTFDTILYPTTPYTKNITIGDLPRESQHAGKIISEYDADNSDYHSFNVFFLALNGAWTQLVRMKRANGKWSQATRVLTSTSSDINKERVLFQQISPDYPDRNVDWLQ